MKLKITKYKKSVNGKYKVYLDDGRELSLYEETILEYGLLLKKEIVDLPSISEYNLKWDVYYVALKSLRSRFKSIYETRKYLKEKDYPIELIDNAINKLVEQGYLNDDSFVKGYINNQIITTSKGPYKIKRELIDKGIPSHIIDDNIGLFDDELQLERVDKLAKKMFKSNRTKGGSVLRKKITNDLINIGYDSELVYKVLAKYDFNDTKEIAKKEYDKLYKKYSRKYEGEELIYKIKQAMYQKGLNYEEE